MNQLTGKTTTDYKKALQGQLEPALHESVNDNVKSKFYSLCTSHSATTLTLITHEAKEGFPYILLKRFRFSDGTIMLKYPEETVFIKGKNLGRLFADIARYKVDKIIIPNDVETDSDDSFIESITIKDNSEVRQ